MKEQKMTCGYANMLDMWKKDPNDVMNKEDWHGKRSHADFPQIIELYLRGE